MTCAPLQCLKQTVGIALRLTRAVAHDRRQTPLPGRAALGFRTYAWVIEP